MKIPIFMHEVVSKGSRLVTNVLFGSKPAGAPVPRANDSWSFSVIGDFGVGSKSQAKVAASLIATQPKFVLTTGDNVYERGEEHEYQRNFDPPQFFGNIRKQFPVYPVLGNHDVKVSVDPYMQRFPEVEGKRYYNFAKDGAAFFAVDSNQSIAPGSTQRKWLEEGLAQAQEGWKIVYFHHPLLSGHEGRSRPEDMKTLAPLFAKEGVDLLLVGHDHVYERSTPINDYGTVQVTVGNGGRIIYPYLKPQPAWSAYRELDFGHLNVEVRPDALVLRNIRKDGKVTDTFVQPQRPAPAQAQRAAQPVPAPVS